MKTCFHSHFYANFHEFYEPGQSKQQICYSFILLFNLFKMVVQYKFSPILMVQMLFFRIQQAPGSDFKIPADGFLYSHIIYVDSIFMEIVLKF